MNSSKLIDRLQQSLQAEYSMIVHYPRFSSTVKDDEIRELILQLGKASVDHANFVAKTLESLGAEPVWSFEPFPSETDPIKIFESQLEKERQAFDVHMQNSEDVSDLALKEKFNEMAKEETRHIKMVKEILCRLRG